MTQQDLSRNIGQFGVLGHEARRHWPLLSAQEVSSVLARYGVDGAGAECVWHGERPFSASGLVRLGSGETLFLKRYDRRLRSGRALEEEHRFIAHLGAGGLPVALPLPTRRGGAQAMRAVETQRWTYEAFAPAAGVDRYCDVPSWDAYRTEADARAAGGMLGMLHRASEGFRAPPRDERPLVSALWPVACPELIAGLSGWVEHQNGLFAALRGRDWQTDIARVFSAHHAALVPLLDEINPLWGHGDWHGSNLFWREGGADIAGIIDFGMADLTCAAFDLAVAIERHAVDWLNCDASGAARMRQMAAFIEGYRAQRSLTAAERALVVRFLPLCHVTFALSEIAYYGSLLGDEASARVAYETYLLGHARWFSGAEGRALLHDLSLCLESAGP